MSIYSKTIDIQKLGEAWTHVRKNKPAAGVDNITYEQFEIDKKEYLAQLNLELQEQRYSTLPVKEITIYKGEKARRIALYSMRDKVVQQSLALELNKVFDSKFSDRTYAYRHDKSALVAIGEINDAISEGRYTDFVKLDIRDFFGSIVWDALSMALEKTVQEEDVIDLIKQNSCGLSIDEGTGELIEKRVGIYQGSGIAPILSNIYLMEFDQWMASQEDMLFVRYSDDMVILGFDRDRLVTVMQESVNRLRALGLEISERKSEIGAIADGLMFLGYAFNENGRFIPKKAEESLQDRLELMWLTSADIGIEDKLVKALEIVGGWEQYFRDEREIGSIFEYAALIYACAGDEEQCRALSGDRSRFDNIYREVTSFLVSQWRKMGLHDMEVFEYEQCFGVPSKNYELSKTVDQQMVKELLTTYRRYYINEDEETAVELMQLYTDLREYDNAEFWQRAAEKQRYQQQQAFDAMALIQRTGDNDIIFDVSTAKKYLRTFLGREDMYIQETIDSDNNRICVDRLLPVTENHIRDHLLGNATYGTFIQRPNSTVRFFIIDVDITKKVLLQVERGTDEFNAYLQKALDRTINLQKILRKWGIQSYPEYSGNRGYHLWVFVDGWISTQYALMLMELAVSKLQKEDSDDISVEAFPNKATVKAGKYGQRIKLPYGIHTRTGERSYFIGDDGSIVLNINEFIDGIARASVADIKRAIAKNNNGDEKKQVKNVEVDTDLTVFGTLDDAVKVVLMNCNLLRYLCQKSQKTGYLSHFERLTVLYVFGHLGDEGKSFVHQVMSYTMNYKYYVTEHFIRHLPEKPISCLKLRDQYKKQTAEFGCNCVFKKVKNCYPSPVLHAILKSEDADIDVTVPTSRTLTKTKEQSVKEELNIHTKTQELCTKVLELKKQRRGLDRSIEKIEKEMGKIFDQYGVDCMEIETGLLVRRRNGDVVEWVIEV